MDQKSIRSDSGRSGTRLARSASVNDRPNYLRRPSGLRPTTSKAVDPSGVHEDVMPVDAGVQGCDRRSTAGILFFRAVCLHAVGVR